jgi:L-fuconolactonase
VTASRSVDRVDAHVHVWDLAVRPQPWTDQFPALKRSFDLEELAQERSANSVERVVLVQADACFAETIDLLAQADAHPEVVGVVGWFDLTAGVAEQIARARSAPGGRSLVGARHQLQTEPDPGWLARPDVGRGLAALADAGLVYDVVVSPQQLPMAADVVRATPGLRFILDHAGKPPISSSDLSRWRKDITHLSGAPNAAVKISGLVTEANWDEWTVAQLKPVVEHLLNTFGPTRAMFGSDWPVCRLAASYAEVVASMGSLLAGLDAAGRDAVWGGTARSWYGLVPG